MDEAEETSPIAVWAGVFTVYGVDIHCYVLDDGRRVFDAGDIERFFAESDPTKAGTLEDMARWIREGAQ